MAVQDWFEWNGEKSTDYGIYVETQPPITIPLERVDTETVPGRAGVLNMLQGDLVYEEQQMTATCWVRDVTQERLYNIGKWLKGGGKVRFANRDYGFYNARVNNQMQLSKIVKNHQHRSFSVTFRCQPFLYLDSGLTVKTVTKSGSYVTNPGSIASEPILDIQGTGTVDFMINGYIFEIALASQTTDWHYVVNSQLQECYASGTKESRNSLMTGDFPILQPGSNQFSWTGTVSKINVTGNWREL